MRFFCVSVQRTSPFYEIMTDFKTIEAVNFAHRLRCHHSSYDQSFSAIVYLSDCIDCHITYDYRQLLQLAVPSSAVFRLYHHLQFCQ